MKNVLEIDVELFHLHVEIFWETDFPTIAQFVKKRGCEVTDEWIQHNIALHKRCDGTCQNIGEGNADVMVWLRKRPTKASEYKTLYHELYHAVDLIADSHNLHGEREARAHLYGFLITKCNQYFWGKPQKKHAKKT
jgi:hypothetical protein